MGLREIAEADLATIMEDRAAGWGWDIVLTTPEGVVLPTFTGFSTDISQAIDPGTGELVSGRLASVALRMSTLIAAGLLTFPQGEPRKNKKPWLVTFADINGTVLTFKVAESRPDRALGVLILILEQYVP